MKSFWCRKLKRTFLPYLFLFSLLLLTLICKSWTSHYLQNLFLFLFLFLSLGLVSSNQSLQSKYNKVKKKERKKGSDWWKQIKEQWWCWMMLLPRRTLLTHVVWFFLLLIFYSLLQKMGSPPQRHPPKRGKEDLQEHQVIMKSHYKFSFKFQSFLNLFLYVQIHSWASLVLLPGFLLKSTKTHILLMFNQIHSFDG